MAVIKIKQGEPFLVYGQYTEDDGITPKPLTGITLKSQVRTQAGKLVATLVFTNVDVDAGTFRMSLPEGQNTGDWPDELLNYDIKDSNGRISETRQIFVEKAQTLI